MEDSQADQINVLSFLFLYHFMLTIILSDLGTIPEKTVTQIDSETDFTILERWMKLAAKSDSIETFIKKIPIRLFVPNAY